MLLAAPVWAQKKSAVSFDSYEYDFGAVNAAEGAICHTFTFKNKSKAPVAIGEVKPSCECIDAQYDTKAVEPGQSATVMVVFTPAKSIGKSYRSVELLDKNGNTLGALSIKAVVSEGPAPQKYPYQNTALSYAERVENLLSLLTPEEKVGLMMNKSVSVDRLGIPSYNWWSEACHGVRQGDYTRLVMVCVRVTTPCIPSLSVWLRLSTLSRCMKCSLRCLTRLVPTGTVPTTMIPNCSTCLWA